MSPSETIECQKNAIRTMSKLIRLKVVIVLITKSLLWYSRTNEIVARDMIGSSFSYHYGSSSYSFDMQ